MTVTPNITSSEIISECLKQHGKGQLFFRQDGREFEEQRVQGRRDFLEAHPHIEPAHRQAILKAAATPGMTRAEVTAAWGLLDEDTRTVFGHVTENRTTGYGFFTGFRVGAGFALYLVNEVVVGIGQTAELVPPHEEELTMRLAEERYGLHFFYEADGAKLVASDYDQYHIDWDTLHLHLYRIESVPFLSMASVEAELKSKGVGREYELTLVKAGYDSGNAPVELRKRVALELLPYPAARRDAAREQQAPAPENILREPIALPASILDAADPAAGPPEKWFVYLAFGNEQQVSFPLGDGGVELLRVEWIRQRVFRVEQVPLLVDGISLYDHVEAQWQEGNLIPRCERVTEKRGRTIRAVLSDAGKEAALLRFAKMNCEARNRYRYEAGVLAFTIFEPALDAIAKEWLSQLPLSWVYTDTLTQE